ncbi:hypothetical protein NDU88_000057 [Pleurodeles waltl]|uniref:Uncharacterized protein n=1 Tax=Pleurodeles waltl TaxID=8319 RepID=A0AAV7TEG0_PLEWA|nr:hypothetical protein NDU88_000057 [Pleurodeles waltl]
MCPELGQTCWTAQRPGSSPAQQSHAVAPRDLPGEKNKQGELGQRPVLLPPGATNGPPVRSNQRGPSPDSRDPRRSTTQLQARRVPGSRGGSTGGPSPPPAARLGTEPTIRLSVAGRAPYPGGTGRTASSPLRYVRWAGPGSRSYALPRRPARPDLREHPASQKEERPRSDPIVSRLSRKRRPGRRPGQVWP